MRLTDKRLQGCCERADKFRRRLSVQQRGSYRIVFYQPRECANANQIIIHQAFWNPDHENQLGTYSVVAKWNSGAAATDANDNFVN